MGSAIRKLGEESALGGSASHSGWPIVAPLAGGGFFATWIQDPTSDWDIFGQYFTADGTAAGSAFVVNSFTAHDQLDPSTATLASGNIIVTWTHSWPLDGGDGSSSGIKAQILDNEGNKIGGEFLINGKTANDQSLSNVFALPSGGFVVTWLDHDTVANGNYNVRGQVFTATGAKIDAEFVVNTTLPEHQSEAVGVALGTGGFVIVWTDQSGFYQGANVAIKGQRFDASGNKLGGEFLVSEGDDPESGADIAALPDGGFVVAWKSYQGTHEEARAQRFDAGGNKIGAEVVASTPGVAAYNVSVTALAWGGYVVAWENYILNQSGVDLRAQLFDATGAKLGGEFVVNDDIVDYNSDLQFDTLASGDVIATWSNGSGETAGTRVQILRMPALGTASADPINGTAGDDAFLALGGADTISTFAGHDYLNGGAGADEMTGGDGDDSYVVDNVGDVVTELLNEGTDDVQTSLGGGDTLQQRRAAMYQLSDHAEILTGTSDQGQGLRGNSGDNIINGAAGDDYVDLTDGGSDEVNSGDGRDVLYYGAALDGSDANDGGDEGGDLRGDLLVIQGDYNITLGAEALVDIEKFRVLKGTNSTFGYEGGGTFNYNITTVDANVAWGERLVVQGGSLQLGEHLIFDGSAEWGGTFQIFGGRDADTLTGGAGEDHLLGRAGDDHLIGNGGNDRLRGGTGNDLLEGGAGADTFIYAALPHHATDPYSVAALESTSLDYDTILGFTFGEDRIDLPQAVTSLGQLLSGSLSDATFDADLAAAVDGTLEANGALLFTADAGDHAGETFLVVDADDNGSYQANVDYVIHLDAPAGTLPAVAADIFV